MPLSAKCWHLIFIVLGCSKFGRRTREAKEALVTYVEITMADDDPKLVKRLNHALRSVFQNHGDASEENVQEDVGSSAIRNLFIGSHLIHNCYLFLLANAAVAYSFVDHKTGADLEILDSWTNWLLGVVNITAVVKYWLNRGTQLEDSTVDVAMCLIPGFGHDVHLAKDLVHDSKSTSRGRLQ